MLRIIVLLAAVYAGVTHAAPQTTDFPWLQWDKKVFEQAKRENKFVLLSLQAWWCHPCHQMNTITYADPAVRAYIDQHFLPVYVDQDNRPDISQRYQRWGWPATVLFAPDGTEIVKLRGFYSPKFFLPILEGTVADPSPIDYGQLGGKERPASQTIRLDEQQRKVIIDFMHQAYDKEHGGWGTRTKFVDGPTFAYALERSASDPLMEQRARETLTRLIGMIDEPLGALSQISLKLDWSEPLEEYPMFAQEAGLSAFSLAYARWGDEKFKIAANHIFRFLNEKMNAPDGGFYTSFGAHNFAPGIDRSRYARENGQAISGLVSYYEASGHSAALDLALRNAQWTVANRSLGNGGFHHDESAADQPFLADTLNMAHAMLKLYRASGDRQWLQRAIESGKFIQRHFVDDKTGAFVSAARPAMGFMLEASKDKDDNVLATRFFNLLWHYTGQTSFRDSAQTGMGYLTSAKVLDAYYFLPGVLQAEYELANEPVHVTVVGHKDDPKAALLYRAALTYPTNYKRAEWWDKREGKLVRDDVSYPQLPQAAAFACSNSLCSAPVTDPDKLAFAIERLSRSD